MQTKSRKQSFFTTEVNDESEKGSVKQSTRNFSNLEQQQQMTQKALQFITKLRTQKKQFDGKYHMIKRAEAEKRQQEQKRRLIQIELQKELKRKIRRIKAQANIQFYKEKNASNQKMSSHSSSPRKRKLSEVTQQNSDICPRIRLPSIYLDEDLQEIKEQSDKVPIGIKIMLNKQAGSIRRAKTEKSDYNHKDEFQQMEQAGQLKLISESKKSAPKFKLRPEHSEQKQKGDRKLYLMRKNRTNDISQISEYLTQYTNLKQLQKLGTQGTNQKRVSHLKNVIKCKKTPRINRNKATQDIDVEFKKQEDPSHTLFKQNQGYDQYQA